MLRENITDLLSFVVVAREGSFTRAAAQIGVSQSALSHAMRGLEDRLGFKLLTRTTRKVTPTAEGERVLARIAPSFVDIEDELQALIESREKPAGTIRLTMVDHAADTVVWPKLAPVLKEYPGLKVEIVTDYALTDIVGERIDAGVRLGEQVSEGMIAARIGPDWRMIVVGSPDYFKTRETPETPQDLTAHSCINLRLSTHGGLYAWEFSRDGRSVNVRVDGQMTFNSIRPIIDASLEGYGLGYVPEDLVADDVAAGRLVTVLQDWTPPFTGYHLYYPHRRQHSPAFNVILDALRHRG